MTVLPKSEILIINVDDSTYCEQVLSELVKQGHQITLADRSPLILEDLKSEYEDKIDTICYVDAMRDIRFIMEEKAFTLVLLFDPLTDLEHFRFVDAVVERLVFDTHRILKATEKVGRFVHITSNKYGDGSHKQIKQDMINLVCSYPHDNVCVRNTIVVRDNLLGFVFDTIMQAPPQTVCYRKVKGNNLPNFAQRKGNDYEHGTYYDVNPVSGESLTGKYVKQCQIYSK